MALEVIYVVRHGYRSNWVVDSQTGEYSASVRSPTGIPSDPALASYGVQQSHQLATHLISTTPQPELIYSSPFYRCLQTLAPYTSALEQRSGQEKKVLVRVEPGVGEFYGRARFDHPSPASLQVLQSHFPSLHPAHPATIVPSTRGESIPQFHDRIAYCLSRLIRAADADPRNPKALLICTHAASMIAIGRTLTGRMPVEAGEEDFRCFTCAFSKFVRKPSMAVEAAAAVAAEAGTSGDDWDPQRPDAVPEVAWRDGRGVAGGWACEVNGDCSFLSGGEERGWNFHMERQRIAREEAEHAASAAAAAALVAP